MPQTIREHLLICLGEELNEMGQEVSKCLRFTDDHRYRITSNVERLSIEYSQMLAVVAKLQELGVGIRFLPDEMDKKFQRLEEFMEISRCMGTLEPYEEGDVECSPSSTEIP